MKIRILLFSFLGLFLVVSMACSLPAVSQQAKGFTATPNMTMTELFGSGILGSLTPRPTTMIPDVPDIVTATFTDTPVPTTTPSSTDTPVPPTSTVTNTGTVTGSPTPPPTLTKGPATQVVSSRSPVYLASYLTNKPTLDGLWTEWNLTQYSANSVTYGAGNWVNQEDLGASFQVGWDETYLYIAAKIGDDVYAQNATGQNLYLGDSLEILMDTNLYGDFYTRQLGSDDFQLGISPGNPDVNGNGEAYLWFPSSAAGDRSQVQIASLREGSVTRVETFIPWSIFGISPYNNLHLGFAFSVSDNDNTGQNLQQSMVSSSPNRHLTNPTTWGELILQK